MELDVRLTQAAVESLRAGGEEGGGRVEVAHEMPGRLAIPELAEAVGQAGVGGIEVLADLTAQSRGLLYEIAAVANDELQGLPSLVERDVGQGEAGGGGAVQGVQVGVVGLVVGIGGLAELLGGEGVDDARLDAGRSKGLLDHAVIA